MEQVDARGQACPLPVVKAKKAFSAMDAGELEVLVDNETAVHNLESLGKSLRCETKSEQREEKTYAVIFTKAAAVEQGTEKCSLSGDETLDSGEVAQNSCASPSGQVVAISSECMGSGDDDLGHTLMKAFVFALTQQDVLPETLLFYNGGVKLTCEGSPVLDDLHTLAEAGTEILSCGTCLNHYGLTEKLAIGEVTNMYVIVEKQMGARVVVRP